MASLAATHEFSRGSHTGFLAISQTTTPRVHTREVRWNQADNRLAHGL
jgi:hypothetical protein